MAGSTYGTNFTITTWGESHGAAIGVVVDGCPAGLPLTEEDIQSFLDRRKPGQGKFTTARKEADKARILSGVFEGRTTGTPISILIPNEDQRSHDYGNIKDCYRPGHADYTLSLIHISVSIGKSDHRTNRHLFFHIFFHLLYIRRRNTDRSCFILDCIITQRFDFLPRSRLSK